MQVRADSIDSSGKGGRDRRGGGQHPRQSREGRKRWGAKAREHASNAMAIGKRKLQKSIYQPVFPEDLEFPKMIVIANDDDRKDVEACQGAVGWLRNAAGLDVLHLYEEVVPLSGLVFFPQPQLYSVYYRDTLDDSRYISLDRYFDTIQKDKFTELKRIAYDLGAKSCRLESSEETKTVRAG